MFSQLDGSFYSQVELGDIKKVWIKRKGMVAVHTQEDKEKNICDVHYSPSITQNLMSFRQMM